MSTCPYCSQLALEGARVCKTCGKALVRRCPFCAEDVAVLAIKCRHCGSDIGTPGRGAPPARPSAAPGAVGETRHIVLTLFLTIITCGIYGLVVQYQIGRELNDHRGKNELSPGLDILLAILTCGAWNVYVHYRYATVLREISIDEGGPVQDVAVACLLLQIFSYCAGGLLSLVSLLVLQNETNLHWSRHRV